MLSYHQKNCGVSLFRSSVKLELAPYKIGVHKVHGYIPLYPWLRHRRGIINIQNKDDKCFWKCLYRVYNPDTSKHDHRDVPAKKLEKFMEENNFDEIMFKEGFTIEKLAMFEEKYKISINIYDIGKNGPEETKQYYCSIYNGDSNINKKINLGIIRNEKDQHFVIVKKLSTIISNPYDNSHGHIKMCGDCGLVCSTTEQLLRHYLKDHKGEREKKQEITLPSVDNSWVKFDMDKKSDFNKTLRYFFVCYADFECSNIPVQDPSSKRTRVVMKQIPNSFMVFCPDFMYLTDGRHMSKESYLKKFHSDDPYEIVKKFIEALETIRESCIFRFSSHPNVLKLTNEEQLRHDAAKVCEKCKNPFDKKERPKIRHHSHITGEYIGPWCRKCNFNEGIKDFELVVFFHNLRGYDSHMIIRYGLNVIAELHKKYGYMKQFVIGKSAEKLSSFQYGKFIFRDSLLHLGCSLERE
jgi:hypothetical protein